MDADGNREVANLQQRLQQQQALLQQQSEQHTAQMAAMQQMTGAVPWQYPGMQFQQPQFPQPPPLQGPFQLAAQWPADPMAGVPGAPTPPPENMPPPLPPPEVAPPLPEGQPPGSPGSSSRLSMDTSSVVSTVQGESRDVVKTVVDSTTFQERIEMVGDILGTDLPTIKKKSGKFLMSVKAMDDGSVQKRLPPSSELAGKFDEFIEELKGVEGSLRGSNPNRKQILEVGKLPGRPRIRMSYYDIADRPWLLEPARPQKESLEDNLVTGKDHQNCWVSNERLMDWERAARQNVSILSHTDHFLSASSSLFEMLYDEMERLDEDDKADPGMVWNIARQGIALMFSAGMGLQDLARNSVWSTGEMVVTRRDAILTRMKGKVPGHNIDELRGSGLNGPNLFDPQALRVAQEAAKARKAGKVQDELISKVTKLADNKSKDDRQKQPFNKQFNKQSFQQMGTNKFKKPSETYGAFRQQQNANKQQFGSGQDRQDKDKKQDGAGRGKRSFDKFKFGRKQ